MRDKAESAGVTGWVRNCRDGSVEAVLEGTQDQLDDMIRWARKGPLGGYVQKVEIMDHSGHFKQFDIERSV